MLSKNLAHHCHETRHYELICTCFDGQEYLEHNISNIYDYDGADR